MDPRLLEKYKKLENSRTVMLMMVKDLNEQQMHSQPAQGKWSIAQTVAHLIEAEGVSVGYMKKKAKLQESLQKTGVKNMLRSMMLKIALRLPIRYKAPRILGPASNDIPIHQLEVKWNEVREDLKELLENISREMMDKAIFKHPYAGYLNIVQTLDFLQEHFNRHLKQIEEKALAETMENSDFI
jgi:hypothetical protein